MKNQLLTSLFINWYKERFGRDPDLSGNMGRSASTDLPRLDAFKAGYEASEATWKKPAKKARR